MTARVLSVQTGRPREAHTQAADGRPVAWTSAIWKTPVSGRVWLGVENLDGDAQADLVHHGGPHRAVLWYGAGHYPRWRAELGLADLDCGWFGENLTVTDLDEESVCIGDVYRIGGPDGAVVQVSQPRSPCWKLARRVGVPDLVARVESNFRSGWYARVLQPGWVAAGDAVEGLERPCPEWTIRRAHEVHLGLRGLTRRRGDVTGSADMDGNALLAAAEALAACPYLSPDWQRMLSGAGG